MFAYYKKFFLTFFVFFQIAPGYIIAKDPTKGFWYCLYWLTGYEFTRNDTVRNLIKKSNQEIYAQDKNKRLLEKNNHDKKTLPRDTDYRDDPSQKILISNLNAIKKHIEKGANPNVCDIWNASLLFILIKTFENNPEQFEKKLKTFVKYGLDVNKPILKNETGLSCVLNSVCVSPKCKLWKSLLDVGANANQKDPLGQLPLAHALDRDNIEAIKDLLQKGSRITDIDNYNNTAFHYKYYSEPIIETIITHTRFFDDENEAIKTKWALQNWTNDRKLSEEELLKNQTIPKEVQYRTLSKLFEEKAFFHAKLYLELLNKGYFRESDFIPAKKHVECLLEILTIKNQKGKTAAEKVQKRINTNTSNGDKETWERLRSLSDGTKLKEDMNTLIQAKDLSQVPPNNLAFRILNNYKKHLNLNIHIPQE